MTDADAVPLGDIRRGYRRVTPDAWAMLAIAVAVMVANLLYISGLFDADPLGSRSGLASRFVSGLLRGQPSIDPTTAFSRKRSVTVLRLTSCTSVCRGGIRSRA